MKKTTPSAKVTSKDLFREVSCPICNASVYSIVYPGSFPKKMTEDFLKQVYRSSSDHSLFEQVVRCTICDMVYLSPRLNAALIVDAYAEGEDQSFIAQDEMRVRTFESALRGLFAKYPKLDNKKCRILDIGSAGGAFLRAAQNLGYEAVGIEPNRWMSQYAKKTYGLDARAGVLSDFKFEPNSFDLITLWDVIEHVPDPNDELSRIHTIMKPNGYLVINYPDFSSLPARILGRKWPFWLSVHLSYYTPATIKKQLAKAGFEVLEIRAHWQTLELGYVLQRITPYFGLAKYLQKAVVYMGMHRIPIQYWVGQTRVVAKKCR